MDFTEAFKTPKRPKFKFGEPLESIYENGHLHAGIKDLFLKAYLSAKTEHLDDDRSEQDDDDDDDNNSVLLALKSGAKGQGTLSQRLSLKTKLEKGEWILPAQTTRGAPLWLLRHFLGRLPQPLLQGSEWKELGRACGEASASGSLHWHRELLLERIAALTKELNQPESEVLALLTLLIRKFTPDKQLQELHRDVQVTDALSQYFIASITTRPFRPGLYTPMDKECQPLLVFIALNWGSIFQDLPEPSIAESTLNDESQPDESYQYFQDDTNFDHKDATPPEKLIGFEQFGQDNGDQLKETAKPERCLRNRTDVIDGLGMIKLFTELHMKSFDKFRSLRDDADGDGARFKLSEFLKGDESLDNSRVDDDENMKDDEDDEEEQKLEGEREEEDTDKHEFYSAPDSDDSSQ